MDIVNNQRLSPRQVLRVFHETCLAVAHMHSRKPPIIHRDLKVCMHDMRGIKPHPLGVPPFSVLVLVIPPLYLFVPLSLLQVENLLLSKDKRIKLCDFGSATTQQVIPDHTWTATQRGLAEDEVIVTIYTDYTHCKFVHTLYIVHTLYCCICYWLHFSLFLFGSLTIIIVLCL